MGADLLKNHKWDCWNKCTNNKKYFIDTINYSAKWEKIQKTLWCNQWINALMNELLAQWQLTEANRTKWNDEHQEEGQKSLFWRLFVVSRQSYDSFIFKYWTPGCSQPRTQTSLVLVWVYETNLLTRIQLQIVKYWKLFHLLDTSTTWVSN